MCNSLTIKLLTEDNMRIPNQFYVKTEPKKVSSAENVRTRDYKNLFMNSVLS